MQITLKRFTPVILVLFVFSFFALDFLVEEADARSRSGGRSFSRSKTVKSPSRTATPPKASSTSTSRRGGFMSGLAGGLLGGAIGSMLFGGLAHGGMGGGLGGSGIGLFQILILAGIGYFVYKRFFKKPATPGAQYQQSSQVTPLHGTSTGGGAMNAPPPPPPPPSYVGGGSLAEGIAMIQSSEPDFDQKHFEEIASDVFFQVQAGWMRRDIQSYRHLLGDHLAGEYEAHFTEMRQKGQINKLENIAVRKVELVDAGVDGSEEFATVLFTANLLDYTVDDQSGDVVEGSKTEPVKFAEKWTWARPANGSENWKLEGVEVVSG